jgi:HK97 family phage major capsid protein
MTMKKNSIFRPALGPMTANERRLGRYIRDGEGHPAALTKQFTDAVEAKLSALSDGVKTALDKSGTLDVMREQLKALEQKMARKPGPSGEAVAPSWGSQLVEAKAAEIHALKDDRKGRVQMQFKTALTSATSDAPGSAGGLLVPGRDGLVGMARRRLTIRDLLNVIPVTTGSVEYPRQTGRTNNAAVVAEGASKPESDLKYDLETVPVRTIAHWLKASRQILDDAPQLQGEVDSELRYGLALAEEGELLTGDGTGQHLFGMIPQATAFATSVSVSNMTRIDAIGLAILQAALTDVEPDGIIIHPADWWAIRLTKNADGDYVFGPPGTSVIPSLFGLPLVPTKAMAANKFLVGAFKAQTLYDRWEARVEVGFVDDDFTRNLVTILGEERIGFAAKRPESLIYGDFLSILGE